jgi:hypothetical protein
VRLAARSALVALASGVYSLLTASPAFMALTTLWNNVPQGTPAPYTVLETFTEVPWNTMAEFGKTCTFQLHTVSQAPGDQEGLTIQDAARTVLDYCQTLAVDNHRVVQVKFETGDHWRDEAIAGVVTRHHVSVYRVDLVQVA